MCNGRGLAVELVDRVSPLCQPVVLGVADTQIVDVPQRVCPAALFGAVEVVVGGIEVADHHTGEFLAYDFIDRGLASTPSQEVPLGGVLKVYT